MVANLGFPLPFGSDSTPLSDAMPNPEATAGTPGVDPAAARGTHVHPRLTSSTRVTLDANGLATVMFTRTFIAKPAIVLTPANPTGRPVQVEEVSLIQSGGLYVGINIHGYRNQLLPSLSGILLIGPLITAISAFDVLGGSAAGVEVSVVAIQASN